MHTLATKPLAAAADYLAPDGSEIRLLVALSGGGLCHCTLPPGATSRPVAHSSVEEIWYCIEGQGEVWRRQGAQEQIVDFSPGVSLGIPPHTAFQFRNTGSTALRFVIATLPPWPGAEEAVNAEGPWSA